MTKKPIKHVTDNYISRADLLNALKTYQNKPIDSSDKEKDASYYRRLLNKPVSLTTLFDVCTLFNIPVSNAQTNFMQFMVTIQRVMKDTLNVTTEDWQNAMKHNEEDSKKAQDKLTKMVKDLHLKEDDSLEKLEEHAQDIIKHPDKYDSKAVKEAKTLLELLRKQAQGEPITKEDLEY